MSHTDDGTLHAFLDGELKAAEEAQLHEHLSICAACRERLDRAREVRGRAHEILRLADPPPVSAPDFATLAARVPSGTEGEAGARGGGRRFLLPWAASIVLAVAAGWFAQQLLNDSRESAGGPVTAVRMQEDAAPSGGAAVGTEDAEAAQDRIRAFATGPASSHGREGEEAAPPAEGEHGTDLDAGSVVAAAKQAVPEDLPGEGSLAAGARDESRGIVPEGVAAMSRALSGAPDRAPAPREGEPNWRPVDRTGATRALGAQPLIVAGLPIAGYGVSAEAQRIRVSQRLPGGERLEIVQRLQPGDDSAETADPEGTGSNEVVVRRGELLIVLQAAVTTDSLSRLAERLR